MKIVISTDSFKGSISSERVGFFVEKGLRKSFDNNIKIINIPIADGGEGSLECLKKSLKSSYKNVEVINPIGKKINSKYLVCENLDLSIIEIAQASGITLINENEKIHL